MFNKFQISCELIQLFKLRLFEIFSKSLLSFIKTSSLKYNLIIHIFLFSSYDTLHILISNVTPNMNKISSSLEIELKCEISAKGRDRRRTSTVISNKTFCNSSSGCAVGLKKNQLKNDRVWLKIDYSLQSCTGCP